MNYINIIHQIFTIIISATGVWLGILAYFYSIDRRNKTNKIFILMLVLMIVWINFAYFARPLAEQGNLSLATTFIKIAWFSALLFLASMYFFTVYYFGVEINYRALSKIIIILAFLSSLLVGLFDFVISGVTISGANLKIIYGSWISLFWLLILILMSSIFYLLYQGYKKSREKREFLRNKYITIGILAFFVANIIFNAILPIFFDISYLYWAGDYSIIILLILFSISIAKWYFLRINIAIAELIIGMFGILLFLQIFFSESLFQYIANSFIFVSFVLIARFVIKSLLEERELKEEYRNMIEEKKTMIFEKDRILAEKAVKSIKLKEIIIELKNKIASSNKNIKKQE